MSLDFLPQLTFSVSQPMLFGALLVLGLVAGEAARRYASLPRITGWVLAGVLLGIVDRFASAYIGQFNSQNPAADLAAPFGEFNFFDVAAYLGLYNAGCP